MSDDAKPKKQKKSKHPADISTSLLPSSIAAAQQTDIHNDSSAKTSIDNVSSSDTNASSSSAKRKIDSNETSASIL